MVSTSSRDFSFCGDDRGKMNINIVKNVWRCNYCNESGGMLTLYAKAQRIINSEAYREICEILQTEGFASEYANTVVVIESEKPRSERASIREVHQIYSILLAMLPLLPAHREHLRIRRGLSNEQIEQYGVKSTPPPYLCSSLVEQKQGCTLQGIQGFL